MTKTRMRLALAMLSLAAGGAQAGAPSDPITQPFLQLPAYRAVALSPDGRHLAWVLTDGEHEAHVAVTDLDEQAEWRLPEVRRLFTSGPRAGNPVARALAVHWVANELIAIDTDVDLSIGFSVKGQIAPWFNKRFVGLYRPDADAEPKAIVQLPTDDSQLYEKSVSLDSKPTPFRPLPEATRVVDWLTDKRGILRALRAVDATKSRVVTFHRESEDAKWREVDERPIDGEPFKPVALSPDPDKLLVQSRNGGDRLGIWEYDVASHRFGALVAGSPDADVDSIAATPVGGGIAGAVTAGLQPQSVWFDPRMTRLQLTVDAALPGRRNVLQPAPSSRLLVQSSSDTDPGRAYVLDTRTMKLQAMRALRPAIDPQRMQPMRTLRYRSVDGTDVPALLTLPGTPATPVPTIILIHDGPQGRDFWQWDRDVQVFAAHGYAVFQPQFRGSAGFGKRYQAAGRGQWGRAIQDDITAGVRWLVDQKIADPDRLCIVGTGYGGYAALWGLAQTPGLYKCGVSVSGVFDLAHLASTVAGSADVAEAADPSPVRPPRDDVSPLAHADRIVAPVLLLHGALDERVPIAQGRAMLAELQRLHKDVQWLEFDDEGHGVQHVANIEKWYGAMFALFARTIGPGVPPSPPLAQASASR